MRLWRHRPVLTDSPAKFLLVDDHESNLVALSAVLSRDDVEMLRARSERALA